VIGDEEIMEDLFYASEDGARYLRKYYRELLLDATYGVTKYGNPFIEIVAPSCVATTVTICGAVMKNETRASYD
jgi:hypothetical protein